MTIEQITDYETRAPALLTDRYRKPAIMAILRSWMAELQEVENVFWALLTERSVANAVGAQLDVLGNILGQPREGRSDEIYRAWVSARVLVLRSSGQAEQLIAIAKRLLPTVPIYLEEYYPLAMMMRAEAAIPATMGAQVAKLLSAAKGGGVALQFEWFATGPFEPFTLAPGLDSVLNSPLGLDQGVLSAVSNGNEVEFAALTFPAASLLFDGDEDALLFDGDGSYLLLD